MSQKLIQLKKRICTALALLLPALCLVGCMSQNAPITTTSLLARCVASGNMDNLHAKGDVKLNVSVGTYRVSIPIVLDGVVAGNTGHGMVTADLSSLERDNWPVEFYVEQLDNAIIFYFGQPGKDSIEWKRLTVETTRSIDLPMLIDLLRSSELTPVSLESDELVKYELTVPLTDVLDTVLGAIAEQPDYGGMSKESLWEQFEDDKVVVDFTEDCLIHTIAVDPMFDYKNASAAAKTITVECDVNCTVDEYGKIDPTQVAIPDDVRNAAVDTDNPFDLKDILGADNPIIEAMPDDALAS